MGRCFAPWRFPSPSPVPPCANWSVFPFYACVASSLSSSPLLLLVAPMSFAALPVGSGARCWRNAPDTDRTRSYGRPDGRRNMRSCRTTDTCIFSRRRRHDKPVVLVPWCFQPAPSPPPSPLSDRSILTVTGAGFCSPSSSVIPPISRGAVADVTTVQNGA